MSENAHSDSDTQETDSNPSGSEELESSPKKKKKKMTEYEKQRARSMEENRARMEAMGLRKMACSVMGSGQIAKEKKREAKGKKRGEEDDDDEYRPDEEEEGDDEEGLSSSSGEEYGVGEGTFRGRTSKAKKKHLTSKKFFDQNLTSNSGFVDDDEALLQAIALSLKDSTECSNVRPNEHSQSSNAHLSDSMINARKENAHMQEDTGKRKRKKPVTSRVKMTEDEFLIHFFQFDETGKGGITLGDLKRVAAAHDFTWTDEEMADMICCFDSDEDGKLSLYDFQKIASQCNMIQVSALL